MFEVVTKFENIIAEFYNAPYAVSTDCCTHAIELCLRLTNSNNVTCPPHTYISVPLTFKKLELEWKFEYNEWHDYYWIGNTNIVDAAVLWKENSYIPNSLMCLSFQYNKHLSLGRGGMILLDNEDQYQLLKKMSYDGRERGPPWASQNIDTIGYHYYMTPETAKTGIDKFNQAKDTAPKKWCFSDYPYLPTMEVFNHPINT